MINKRGNITVNNIVTAVIAIICIVALGFAIAKLYNNFKDQENKNAQKTLEGLVAKINVLEDGGSSLLGVTGLNTKWFVAGWNADESGRPAKCYLGSCVCICNRGNHLIGYEVVPKPEVAVACQENGYCNGLKVDAIIIQDSAAKISTSSGGPQSGTSSTVSTVTTDYIRFTDNLVALKIDKIDSMIFILKQEQNVK